jgi:hypothetical protein
MVPLVVYQSLGAKAWEVGGVTAAASCDEPNASGSDIMSPKNLPGYTSIAPSAS